MRPLSKLPKPTRRPKRITSQLISSETEYNGFLEGSIGVALGVSTTNRKYDKIDGPYYLLAAAIWKRFFKKHFSADVTGYQQRIGALVPPNFNIASTAQNENPNLITRVTFYFRKSSDLVDGDITMQNIDFTKLNSFNDLCTMLGAALLDNCCRRDITANTGKILIGYTYVTRDGPDFVIDVNSRYEVRNVSALQRLDNVMFKIKMVTDTKLQNVTAGHDIVATMMPNPLKGRILHFKDPCPIAKLQYDFTGTSVVNANTSNQYLSLTTNTAPASKIYALTKDVNEDGLIVPTGLNGMEVKHMARTDQFENCTGYSTFIMNPGEIKRFKSYFNFYGTIEKFLNGMPLDVVSGNVVRNDDNLGFGTCDLFLLEQLMSSAATGSESAINTRLSWEVKRYATCSLGKTISIGMDRMRDYTTPATTIAVANTNTDAVMNAA